MTRWRDLFTPRQLVALSTFSELVADAIQLIKRDALAAGLPDDDRPLGDGSTGGYADLSDFFYVWLRRVLKTVLPDVFATLMVPKDEELVANPFRHGGRKGADRFFLDGMTSAMGRLAENGHADYPIVVYYAARQTDKGRGGTKTDWETFLEAVIGSGLRITGTWPVRTERETRSVALATNALASSIVLVCRRRREDSPLATRREFVRMLRDEMPRSLMRLQSGSIAPVDLL